MKDLWAEGCCSTGPDLVDTVGNMDTQIGNSLHSKMEEFQTAGSPDESAAGQRLVGLDGRLDCRTAGWSKTLAAMSHIIDNNQYSFPSSNKLEAKVTTSLLPKPRKTIQLKLFACWLVGWLVGRSVGWLICLFTGVVHYLCQCCFACLLALLTHDV